MHPRKSPWSNIAAWSLGTALVAAPVTADADTPAQIDDLSLEELLNMEVDTVTRRIQPLQWAPARSVVVTRSQIRQRRYVNLRDLLQDMPEIDVFNNHWSVTRSVASVRGLAGNNRFLVLIDGIRINAMTGDEAPVEDNYPLFDAERVEVIYGPASALYGADALVGVINIVTRREEADRGASVAASYGSADTRYGSAKAFTKIGEHARLSLSAHAHTSDSPDLAKAYPGDFQNMSELRDPFTGNVLASVPDNRFSNKVSSYSLSARLTFDKELTAGYDLRQFTQLTAVGVKPEYTVYGSEAPHRWQTVYLTYRKEFLPKLESSSEVNYSIFTKQPAFAYNNTYTGGQPQHKYAKSTSFSVREQLAYAVTPDLDIVAGVSWAYIHALPETGTFATPFDEGLPSGSQGQTIIGTSIAFPFYEHSYQTLGSYLQTQAQLTSSLAVTAGVRFDRDTRYGNTLNPRAGVVYQITPGQTAKLLYGESFLAPPPAYQYAFWGSFAGVDENTGRPFAYWYHVPNPDLDPMKARTVEFDYSLLAARDLLVELDGYFSLVDGITVARTVNEPTNFAGADIFSYEEFRSEGRARLYGGSVSLRYRTQFGATEIEPWGSFSLSLGKNLDRPEDGWTDMPLNVPYKVKGGITVKRGAFSFTPRVRWNSRSTQYLRNPEQPAHRLTAPAHAVVDAALRADDLFVHGLSLALDVRNVLDARYYMPGAGGPLDFVNSPQDPRTAMLELSFNYD
ncbi:TonB-dependent siderophore receptor [Myxococcus sp. RHSTA-1-4]|uniref:TonB-dependent receptor plug domain-containing protein n=1 Tax=Myxococcus sp. RHSTA-1-4 TaxID=2874601 RepID=UPI001CC1C132|nr:TonB-dependent receptor [Myxococcus sp. RHSTA-1-4]MBZ4418037.1 TonB-dependent receptor [Myxococcus sp. RHSTA-1-4]